MFKPPDISSQQSIRSAFGRHLHHWNSQRSPSGTNCLVHPLIRRKRLLSPPRFGAPYWRPRRRGGGFYAAANMKSISCFSVFARRAQIHLHFLVNSIGQAKIYRLLDAERAYSLDGALSWKGPGRPAVLPRFYSPWSTRCLDSPGRDIPNRMEPAAPEVVSVAPPALLITL